MKGTAYYIKACWSCGHLGNGNARWTAQINNNGSTW